MPAALLSKGERTRAAILGEALRLVSKAGLDGLTIGTLADATGLSKSGLFAHFGSREELLLAVLDHGQTEFTEGVLKPALAQPRGVPRLAALFPNWPRLARAGWAPRGCPRVGGAPPIAPQPRPRQRRGA